ncbi:PH domain-containing protein [Flavobacterium sp.]|uniref:PH domain-containing protein n=1 Tax=Flavobacterium sp. TaxID=239 RepID=UPI00121417F9|nr:PH domain-containing protein [Flavobacterium sp.]RZJ69605.1 MAG: PH domain-containing protein [Flavobacterium sp.]
MPDMKLRKHWLCYAPVWFIAIICILLIVFGTGKIAIFGWILLSFDFLGYFTIKNYTWTLTGNELIIQSGVLPWQKNYIRVPAAGLFGATVKRGFFGWFLDYGTITINSIGGASSKIEGKHMKGAVAFMENIGSRGNHFATTSLE